MLRVWVMVSLLMTLVFTGIGLATSKAWGWSEYASDELYLVYMPEKIGDSPYSYFIANADGSGEHWKLAAATGTLTKVNCSPDGRTVTFVTDAPHLYIVNRSGIVFDRVLGQASTEIISSNGFDASLGDLIINSYNHILKYPEDGYEYAPPRTSPSGMLLWNRLPMGILMTTSTGEFVTSLSQSTNAAWLASKDVFTFTAPVGYRSGWHQYLEDIRTRNVIMLPPQSPSGVFSPDGTVRAKTTPNKSGMIANISLTSVFSNDPIKQLTFSLDAYYIPVCFLTFRPQILLADNP
nr:hypothetical protein [uncultured bacterium]